MKKLFLSLALLLFLPISVYANDFMRITTYIEVGDMTIPIIKEVEVTRHLTVQAVAYSPEQTNLSPYTFSGLPLVAGLAAVDPNVIPLGTYFYVPGYGLFLAADIGSAIRGYMVDLAFDTIAEALEFGRKNVELFVLDMVTDLF